MMSSQGIISGRKANNSPGLCAGKGQNFVLCSRAGARNFWGEYANFLPQFFPFTLFPLNCYCTTQHPIAYILQHWYHHQTNHKQNQIMWPDSSVSTWGPIWGCSVCCNDNVTYSEPWKFVNTQGTISFSQEHLFGLLIPERSLMCCLVCTACCI